MNERRATDGFVSVDMLVCPTCKQTLARQLNTLRCTKCDHDYTTARGIPDLRLPAAGDSGHDTSGSATDDRYMSFRLPSKLDDLVWKVYGSVCARIYETRLWWPRLIDLATLEHDFSADDLMRWLFSRVPLERGRILDVACGPGTLGRRLASPSRGVYGVDLAMPMLVWATYLTARERVPNMQFACASAENLPFSDGVFDVALLGGALHWIPDPVRALRELCRTLESGAPMSGYTATVGERSSVGRKISGRGGHLFPVSELEAFLQSAGFVDIECEVIGELLLFHGRRG